ncbi:MAG: hypothetical protein U5O39_10650 [Gammaproteobacteria bacterium]|nr:hypothetical protein [Gammaproteobacteria bacterium]
MLEEFEHHRNEKQDGTGDRESQARAIDGANIFLDCGHTFYRSSLNNKSTSWLHWRTFSGQVQARVTCCPVKLSTPTIQNGRIMRVVRCRNNAFATYRRVTSKINWGGIDNPGRRLKKY